MRKFMNPKKRLRQWTAIFGLTILPSFRTAAADTTLRGPAAALYEDGRTNPRFREQLRNLRYEVAPTSDGRSFFIVWKPINAPKRWIVSLHGAGEPARGFATDDLAVWSRHLAGHDVGLLCLQWWLGTGSGTKDFYTPPEMYREIQAQLTKLHVRPGDVMFHGFSRGAANTYAVSALDSGKGEHFFSLNVASSGGASLDYPPNGDLLAGRYGREPLKGTRWILVSGAKDPHPDRDGITGMRRTADWLKQQGAVVVDTIEDSTAGHGALQTNPKNTERVLERFLK